MKCLWMHSIIYLFYIASKKYSLFCEFLFILFIQYIRSPLFALFPSLGLCVEIRETASVFDLHIFIRFDVCLFFVEGGSKWF